MILGPESTHRILSRPLKLYWAGWESDTYALQQAGWQLSAEQLVHEMSMILAIKHPLFKITGLSQRITDFDYFTHYRGLNNYAQSDPRIGMAQMASSIQVHIHEPMMAFSPIDAKPQFNSTQVKSLDELAHFAPPLVRTQQIILPEPSVNELLARILEIQQPERQAYLEEKLRDERVIPRQRFHAQIISLAA